MLQIRAHHADIGAEGTPGEPLSQLLINPKAAPFLLVSMLCCVEDKISWGWQRTRKGLLHSFDDVHCQLCAAATVHDGLRSWTVCRWQGGVCQSGHRAGCRLCTAAGGAHQLVLRRVHWAGSVWKSVPGPEHGQRRAHGRQTGAPSTTTQQQMSSAASKNQ